MYVLPTYYEVCERKPQCSLHHFSRIRMDPTTTIHHVLKVQIDSEPLLVPLPKWVVTNEITKVRSTLTDVVTCSLPEIITHSHY